MESLLLLEICWMAEQCDHRTTLDSTSSSILDWISVSTSTSTLDLTSGSTLCETPTDISVCQWTKSIDETGSLYYSLIAKIDFVSGADQNFLTKIWYSYSSSKTAAKKWIHNSITCRTSYSNHEGLNLSEWIQKRAILIFSR